MKNASGSEARATDTKSAQAETADSKKSGRKGITIVENRPKRKTTGKPKITPPTGTLGALLAKRRRQPLIPSGPDAPPSPFGTFGQDGEEAGSKRKLKSPFKKRELDGFREKLLAKRRELVGDVANMESGMASRGDRGGNPALDVAEQGSDAYDQSLSIGFAEADRKIIREIDEALKRIDDGTYGLCEMTRQPIGVERLNQLPWARLSIEAAREIERRGGGR
ncbi:MAG: TraR/DksA family transcriptional regulator [Phycisphaerales bacterium]